MVERLRRLALAPQLKRDPLGSNRTNSPMDPDSFDDPDVQAAWLAERRAEAHDYLRAQQVPAGRVADHPAWHLAPYVSLWQVLGDRSGLPQYWVIVGDLPADFLPADAVTSARAAVAAFAQRWLHLGSLMLEGKPHPTLEIGSPDQNRNLGDLLLRRARLLADFAREDQHW